MGSVEFLLQVFTVYVILHDEEAAGFAGEIRDLRHSGMFQCGERLSLADECLLGLNALLVVGKVLEHFFDHYGLVVQARIVCKENAAHAALAESLVDDRAPIGKRNPGANALFPISGTFDGADWALPCPVPVTWVLPAVAAPPVPVLLGGPDGDGAALVGALLPVAACNCCVRLMPHSSQNLAPAGLTAPHGGHVLLPMRSLPSTRGDIQVDHNSAALRAAFGEREAID
jgi:hypothetical protein